MFTVLSDIVFKPAADALAHQRGRQQLFMTLRPDGLDVARGAPVHTAV